MAFYTEIEFERGEDLVAEIVFGRIEDFDANDYNFYGSYKKSFTSTLTRDFTLQVMDVRSVFIRLSREETADIVAGKYYFDIFCIHKTTEFTQKIVEGKLLVNNSATTVP